MRCIAYYFKNSTKLDEFSFLTELPKIHDYIFTFDQATRITGFSIYTTLGDLVGVVSLSRNLATEKKGEFKAALKKLLIQYKERYNVVEIIHEDTFGSMEMYGASEDLNKFKTVFEDLKFETYKDLIVTPSNNKHWKKRFVYPAKLTALGKVAEKKQIKEKALEKYPFLGKLKLPQDVFDSVGIGEAYFNVKFKRIPEKLCYAKPKVNKALTVELEVNMFKTPEEIKIKSTNLQKYFKKYGSKNYNFDTQLSLEDNIRVYSQEQVEHGENKLIYLVIPEYSGIGEICLNNGCKYKKNHIMVCFGKLKSRK